MIASTGLKPVFPTRDYIQGATDGMAELPTEGRGVTVAVFDSGVRPHEDFGDRLLPPVLPEFSLADLRKPDSVVDSPAVSPDVITVGGYDARNGQVLSVSSRGDGAGGKPDLLAPAVGIVGATSPETPMVRQAFQSLQMGELREETVDCWSSGRSSSQASRLAEGHTAPYDQPLRDISQLPHNPDPGSPHELSRPFSHAFFKALRAAGEGRSNQTLTEDVLLQTSQDFLNLLDLGMEFLPVSGQATVQQMLTAMLKVDRLVFQSRYQRALTENFQSVGLVPQSEQPLPSDIVVEIPDALTRNSYENSFGMHFTHFDTPAGRGLMVATDEGNLIHLDSPAKQTEKRIKP